MAVALNPNDGIRCASSHEREYGEIWFLTIAERGWLLCIVGVSYYGAIIYLLAASVKLDSQSVLYYRA